MASERSGNPHFAVFERLAQSVEQVGWKFAEFVQKERAEISEGDFAGPGVRSSSKQARHARSRMYGYERSDVRKRVFARFSRDGTDFREGEDFGIRGGRENARERPAEKGFSRARSAFEKDVVSSGGGDFEHAFRPLLSGDVAKIGNVANRSGFVVGVGRFLVFKRNRQAFPAFLENLHRIGEILGSVGPDSRNPRGLPGVRDGKEEVGFSPFGERCRMRHDSPYATEVSVERQFPQDRDSLEIPIGKAAFFRKYAYGYGEIERRSGFADFRRREVDRHPLLREGESRVPYRGADAFAALLYGRVAEADDGKGRESGGDVDFDRNGMSRQAANRRRKYGFNHKKSAENDIFALPKPIIPKTPHS
ncbi:MAG: hypothetical protein WA194_07545 [Patescibacteria group bacterium]